MKYVSIARMAHWYTATSQVDSADAVHELQLNGWLAGASPLFVWTALSRPLNNNTRTRACESDNKKSISTYPLDSLLPQGLDSVESTQ